MSRTRRRNINEHDTRYYKDSAELPMYGNYQHRDKKPGEKQPGWFKRIRRRLRRHRAKMAIRNNEEPPVEKHDDQWEWT